MNDTTKCWVIANFEIVLFWCVGIIGTVLAIIIRLIIGSLVANAVAICMATGALLALAVIPTKEKLPGIVKYIFLIMIGVLLTLSEFIDMGEENPFLVLSSYWIVYWVVFIAGSLLGRAIAIYTYHNFQEVVSRRMLYRNSNVDLFEIRWKYVIDRFTNIAWSSIACFIELCFIIWFCINA
jgi:hypothetical protein